MVELKTGREVEAMRAAGRVVAQVLAAVKDCAGVRVRLNELDRVARDVLSGAGATSPFLGYQPGFATRPFPAVICTSVNDAALHGIPGRYRLADGDLLSVDCGATLDGWTGDAAISFTVGEPRQADLRLIACVQSALSARDRGRRRRGQARRHLGGDRRGRASRRLRYQHRLWRPRNRARHARGPLDSQRRPTRPRA